jgi:hypothetical protein
MGPKQIPENMLTEPEKKLLEIAVRLYCAIKYYEEHEGVSLDWLAVGIENELVCVNINVIIVHWLRAPIGRRRIQWTRYSRM